MLSLLLPHRCVHCAEPAIASWFTIRNKYALAKYLCPNCARVLEADEAPKSKDLKIQISKVSNYRVWDAVAGFTFLPESPVQSLIHSLKYSGMMGLGELLGSIASENFESGFDCIVPVPLHRTRLAERGYNQSNALATGVAAQANVPVIHAAKRIRATPTQTKLSIRERIDNVRGAFALTRNAGEIEGKHVVIIDDVMTTGATMMSIAETLSAADPRAISILALAAVMI